MPWGIGPEDGWTYLIQAVDGGPVKIGFTRTSPSQRLKELQVGNPQELRIVGLLVGNWHERRLHAKFHHRRIRGEWFEESVLEDYELDRQIHAVYISSLAVAVVYGDGTLVRSI